MPLELLPLEQIQEIAHHYGYWSVFLGIALENMGIPLPGETITIVGGFLAGSGELNYWLVLAATIAGAVLGDNFGYWLGKIGGWQFMLRLGRFFRIKEVQLEEARRQFSKNAAMAVFFGRFVTLLRIFAGPMAGITEMPYPQFFLCNFGGAALWAAIIVTFSFFFGRLMPLHQLVNWIAKLGMLALVLVIVAVAIIILWKAYKSRLTASIVKQR